MRFRVKFQGFTQGGGQVEVLLTLPRLCFFQMATIKKNLRLFNGFPFLADSDQYSKKRDKLLKSVPDQRPLTPPWALTTQF